MSELSESIHAYHDKMHSEHLGYNIDTLPTELLAFRRRLHDEEVREVTEAWDSLSALDSIRGRLDEKIRAEFDSRNLEERDERVAHLMHELADVVIVAFGTADYLGINFDGVLRAVMRANMKKIPPKVPGGKATKPDGWVPSDAVIVELIKIARRNRLTDADPFASAPTKVTTGYAEYGHVFRAQFTGSICPQCDDEIECDEPCRMGPNGITHATCAEADEVEMSGAGWTQGPDGWEP